MPRRRLRCTSLGLLATCLVALPIFAQSPVSAAAIDSGTRVRVKVADRQVEGALAQVGHDTVSIRTTVDGPLLSIPTAQISSFEAYEGTRTYRARGALIGAGVGVAVGALGSAFGPAWVETCGSFSLGGESPRTCSRRDMTASERMFFGAIATTVIGLAGAGIGTLFGSLGYDNWRSIPAQNVRVSVTPLLNRQQVGAQIQWRWW